MIDINQLTHPSFSTSNNAGSDCKERRGEAPQSQQVPSTWEGRTRRVNRTPTEEMAWRIERDQAPEPIPVAFVALILARTKTLKLTRNGIAMTVNGQELLYWHENAVTCQPRNVGQKVSFAFDLDDLAQIHILDSKGRYLESIPQKNEPGFFTPELAEERRKHTAIVNQTHKRLEKLHAFDTNEALDRTKKNAEALQAVNTFPIEQDRVQGSRETADLPAAERLQGNIESAKSRVEEHKERTRKNQKATDRASRDVEFSPESFADITREDATEIKPEDDVDFDTIRDVLSNQESEQW